MFYILLQLIIFLTAETLPQNDYESVALRFGVFISQESSNSFGYAGFQPSLELGFKTVNDSSVLTRGMDGKKYQITYTISDAMVSDDN